MKVEEIKENAEELEYFGVSPSVIAYDLQQRLENTLNESISIMEIKNTGNLKSHFKKYLVVTVSFLLRNVLKFPNKFVFERRITDKVVHLDSKLKLGNVYGYQEECGELMDELNLLKAQYAEELGKNRGYKALLKGCDKYRDLFEGISEVNGLIKENNELYSGFVEGDGEEEDEFSKFMEHKYMENEYYGSEKKRLNDICRIETLDFIMGNLKK